MGLAESGRPPSHTSDLEYPNDYNVGTASNNVFSLIIHEPTPSPCGHYTAHVVAGLCKRRHFEGCRTGLSNAALHGVLSEHPINDCIKLGKCFLNRRALQSSEQWGSLNRADPLAYLNTYEINGHISPRLPHASSHACHFCT